MPAGTQLGLHLATGGQPVQLDEACQAEEAIHVPHGLALEGHRGAERPCDDGEFAVHCAGRGERPTCVQNAGFGGPDVSLETEEGGSSGVGGELGAVVLDRTRGPVGAGDVILRCARCP